MIHISAVITWGIIMYIVSYMHVHSNLFMNWDHTKLKYICTCQQTKMLSVRVGLNEIISEHLQPVHVLMCWFWKKCNWDIPAFIIMKNEIVYQYGWNNWYTVFDLIIAPALITAPPPDFLLYFHLSWPTWQSFPDFWHYFHLLSPTWRSFETSGREQIYVSAQGAY